MRTTANAIAQVCHEANRAFCATIGDHSQVAWDDAPDWQKESALDGVRGVIIGSITTPEQAHESWCDAKLKTGWVYGEKKDAETKTHHCLVPYDQLPEEQRSKDALFFAVVRALAE
jgi:hypothetical protein